MGKLVKARRKMMAARPGRVPRIAGQSMTAKRVHGASARLWPVFSRVSGMASSRASRMRAANAPSRIRCAATTPPSPKTRQAEEAQPAGAAPDRQQAERDDETRRDDGRGEEADDEGSPGKPQAVERPGESDADDQREYGREHRLQRRDVNEVAEIDMRTSRGLPRCGIEDRPEQRSDQGRDEHGDGRPAGQAERPMRQAEISG